MKKKNFVEMVLVIIIALGLTIVVGGLFGCLVAYEAFTTFGVSFEGSILIGAASGIFGGLGIGFHFIEDFGA